MLTFFFLIFSGTYVNNALTDTRGGSCLNADRRRQAMYTPIEKRKFKDRKIKAPLSDLGDRLEKSSWKDDYMLNMLWACILAGNLDQKRYTKIFEKVLHNAERSLKNKPFSTICHNYLATLDQSTFNSIFSPILEDEDAAAHILAIRLVEGMPDAILWGNFLPNPENINHYWYALKTGVFSCIDPGSKQGLDVRSLKVRFLTRIGRVKNMTGKKSLSKATHGATEIVLRCMEEETEKSPVKKFPSNKIWTELFEKTDCTTLRTSGSILNDYEILTHEISSIIRNLCWHFEQTLKSTHVDAKIDTAFGLVIYSLSIARELSETDASHGIVGRIALRSIAESLISLTFLRRKDNPKMWMMYRNSGTGRAAQTFLKSLNWNNPPVYLEQEKLEHMANEDEWLEMADIETSPWSGKDLRKMAIEAKLKDIYDSYYEWTSGFAHAQWGAIRDSVFTICYNPLHRFHRIPKSSSKSQSVLDDCCKLCNLLLTEIETMYPAKISRRITWTSEIRDEDLNNIKGKFVERQELIQNKKIDLQRKHHFLITWKAKNSSNHPLAKDIDRQIALLERLIEIVASYEDELHEKLCENIRMIDKIDNEFTFTGSNINRMDEVWDVGGADLDSILSELGYDDSKKKKSKGSKTK